ncbi:hypothetical protein C2E23DRAFT_740832 [Lenzites betulinus]|nr:hypothetical protein C2E23DRAFT_740832 [Lenzites betulinus]
MTFVNEISLISSNVPVKAATIFQSRTAEVTRSLALQLKSGRNVVTIRGISSYADTESPRISGTTGDVRVLDIVCKQQPPDAPDMRDSFDSKASEIEALRAKGRTLEAEKNVRKQEADLLDDAARLVTTHKSPASQDPIGMITFMEKFVQRKIAAQNTVQALEAQILALQKKLWVLTNARKGDATTTIIVTIAAKEDVKVDLQLTYLVAGVSWRPFYDLYAKTADGQPSADVSMRYYATVMHSSGEDWTDTSLTLSTATSQTQWRLSVPSVSPREIKINTGTPRSAFGFPQPQQQHGLFGAATSQQQQGLFGAATSQQQQGLFGAATHQQENNAGGLLGNLTAGPTSVKERLGAFGATLNPPAPPPPPAPPAPSAPPPAPTSFPAATSTSGGLFGSSTPTPDRNALSVAYRVQGAVSLPSDGEEHRLTVAVLDFKAALKYVCVPAQSQEVFIVSTVKNTSKYELLAGPVNVFMDDRFVTKTSVEFIAVNGRFSCVLGVDTSLKVKYQQSEKTEHEQRRNFAEPRKTNTRTKTTKIVNQHPHAVTELFVRDAVPLSNEEAKIAVTLCKPAGLAEVTEGDAVDVKFEDEQEGVTAKARWTKVVDGKGGEKDGLYEWECSIDPGKKITLEAQWDVKGPENLEWSEVYRGGLFGQKS